MTETTGLCLSIFSWFLTICGAPQQNGAQLSRRGLKICCIFDLILEPRYRSRTTDLREKILFADLIENQFGVARRLIRLDTYRLKYPAERPFALLISKDSGLYHQGL